MKQITHHKQSPKSNAQTGIVNAAMITAKYVAVTAVIFSSLAFIGLMASPNTAMAATCPGGGQAPDGDVANCPSSSPSPEQSADDPSTTDLGDWKLDPGDGSLKAKTTKPCGSGNTEVQVAFDFGCTGTGNAIIDIAFAIFRFLSYGVGLIVIGSIVVAGIQYSASRGDPQATEASIKRVSNAVVGLLLYIFLFAIANFLVPGGML